MLVVLIWIISLAIEYRNGMPDPLNMASSGKKGKKTKGKTIPLTNFLQDTPGIVPVIPVRHTSNWADEIEDSYDGYDGGRFSKPPKAVVLPTAPKAARGLDDYSDKIPQNPPYIAYLSNLPYEVEEDEIADYFCNLKITKMHIPKEGEGSRARGFGYVEFEDRESLVEALTKPVTHLKGRRIRVDVATNTDNDRRRGRMDMNRDRPDRPEVSMGDWRSSSGRTEQEPARRGGYRTEGFSRDREGGSGGGGSGFSREREAGQDRPGAWRDGNDRPSFNDRYRDDKGPITRDGPPRDSRDRYERDGDRRFGGRRNDERNGGFSRGGGGREDQDRGEPRTRPRLNLAPRTQPIENPLPPPESEPEAEPAAPKPAPVPAASIFGNAKPVDTAAKERLIEERLAKQSTDVDRDDRRRDNGRGRKGSPERRRYTSPRRSADRRTPDGDSPDRNKGRRDDKRGPPPSTYDKPAVKNERKPPPRENTEKTMPKLQSPEPVNIVAKNQYSFLAAEEESD